MTRIIIVHAWHRDEQGNQTYSDPSVDPIEGWCAYLRVPRAPAAEDGAFEVPWEADFATREIAVEAAKEMAAIAQCDVCVED
jgi:hypothetical protein